MSKHLGLIFKLSIWRLLLFLCFVYTSSASGVLKISENDLSLKIDETTNISLKYDSDFNQSIKIWFSCDHSLDFSEFNTTGSECQIFDGFPKTYDLSPNETLVFELRGVEPGRQTLIVNTYSNQTDAKNAFIRINVGRNKAIDVISVVIGWLYFIAWSVSFYPQIYSNYKRKSVIGLDFNYLALNNVGFICYSVFNVCLFFSPLIQSQFEEKYPRSLIPVEANDVFFALHAEFATFLTLIQCFIYERGDQTLSVLVKSFVGLWLTVSLIIAILVPTIHWINWLTYLYIFSYVKLFITLVKYIPQAWHNYQRKSTEGWSILNVLLDFTGGVLSLFQMFLLAYNYDDWLTIFKNFTKFGLGALSIIFDIVFIVQHYVLYRNAPDFETLT